MLFNMLVTTKGVRLHDHLTVRVKHEICSHDYKPKTST